MSHAQDVREAVRKAEKERQEALERAKQIEESIINDRAKLLAEVEKLESEQLALEEELKGIERRTLELEARREYLSKKWTKQELDTREISGNVKIAARDLETLLQQSHFTALDPDRMRPLSPVLREGYFPGIDDISRMTDLYFDEIEKTGQVGLIDGSFVGREGEDQAGRILTLGAFTTIYRDEQEIGFLQYSSDAKKLFAMRELPPGSMQRKLKKYLEGNSADVIIDISQGAALRQIVHKTSVSEQLKAGGPLVYPIAAVAAAALFIVISKLIFLSTVRRNTGKYMTRVNKLAAEGNWEECEDIVRRHKGEHSPVNHVIEAGLTARSEDRETLESILQESILRELPRLERGLSPLAIFGAVAPLLGLLGTVTGMIDTFRVITLYGTGDPKLMSGGISEALVTTELGLIVAIPIMLLHTFLSRRVDHIVGEMEEKAVSMINIIEKEKRRNGGSVPKSPCNGVRKAVEGSRV
jgi:biopolymer transport protein ExbB